MVVQALASLFDGGDFTELIVATAENRDASTKLFLGLQGAILRFSPVQQVRCDDPLEQKPR